MAEIPQTIGKYKIQEQIAQGGMGAIYKSVHPELKRAIIIKKMTMRGNALAREQFLKEAQILLDMQSPYIVHLFDYFSEGGYRYIVEEFVEGLALDKLIKKQVALSPQVAMLILQDACFGLRFAHNKKIVHRDIKPGNILISKRGEIKITDFGIASDSSDDEKEKGVMLGTPSYMPPEQFKNTSAVDQRADIYALGVMLYEMLTGTKPYTANTPDEMYEKARKGKYISPRKINKEIPREIERLIKKMMKPKATRRFKSVEPIIRIVKKYLKNYDTHAIRVEVAKMIISTKPLKETQFKKRRDIWKTIFVALVATGILCFGGYYLWNAGLIHRTILRNWYTPVSISMKLPQSTAPASDIKARAIFFTNGNKIDQVENSERLFEEGAISKKGVASERLGSKERSYKIKPVFLKPGMYRAKVVVGSYVWWENFEVTRDEKILDINLHANESRPITISMTAFDGKTGEDITSKTRFTVLYGGSWVSLNKVPREKFNSAAVWKFKASHEGYEDEVYSLLIDWYQDTVSIRAELFPLEK